MAAMSQPDQSVSPMVGLRLWAMGDGLAADEHGCAVAAAVDRPGAVHRVKLEQVGRACSIVGDLVHLDDRHAVSPSTGPQAHAAEAVDANTNCHASALLNAKTMRYLNRYGC